MLINEIILNIPEYLYHATYKPRLKSILTFGLGSKSKKNWEDSKDGVVYLASDYDEAYSYAETSDLVPESYLDNIVVFQIETSKLNKKLLYLDNNVIDGSSTFEYHGIIPGNFLKILKR